MSELVIHAPPHTSADMRNHIRKTRGGRIKTGARCKSRIIIKITIITLLCITVYGFLTFDYGNVNLSEAVSATADNVGVMFGEPRLKNTTVPNALMALLQTFSLGVLSTIAGAIIAFFGALLCARNIAKPAVSIVIRSIVAFVRAVPTILWVLIFTVAAGLGSVAAVAGMTFHSASYLIKAYSESIEEIDGGVIEALRAGGAGYWQILFQAILPASISYMTAWTFLRFEINFTTAIAMGAAAGAGGIGYDLFMAGTFYHDLRELGFITYMVIAAVILLEIAATKIKAKVR